MRQPGHVLTRFQLLEQAWEYDFEHRSNVIEVYIRYLRRKIDQPFGVELDRDRARRRLPAAKGRRPLSRLSIRLRVTLAFAAVMALVLGATGVFVYLASAELDTTINAGLRSRAGDVAASGRPAPEGRLSERRRNLVGRTGASPRCSTPRARSSTRLAGWIGARSPCSNRAELRAAARGPIFSTAARCRGLQGRLAPARAPVATRGGKPGSSSSAPRPRTATSRSTDLRSCF